MTPPIKNRPFRHPLLPVIILERLAINRPPHREKPMKRLALIAFALLMIPIESRSADEPTYTRQEDVVYGRKDGTALTMDVFRPKAKANGAG